MPSSGGCESDSFAGDFRERGGHRWVLRLARYSVKDVPRHGLRVKPMTFSVRVGRNSEHESMVRSPLGLDLGYPGLRGYAGQTICHSTPSSSTADVSTRRTRLRCVWPHQPSRTDPALPARSIEQSRRIDHRRDGYGQVDELDYRRAAPDETRGLQAAQPARAQLAQRAPCFGGPMRNRRSQGWKHPMF